MIVTGLVAAAAWGVLMGDSPMLQIRRIVRHRSSRDVSIGYFAVLLVGFPLWLSYGVAARTWPPSSPMPSRCLSGRARSRSRCASASGSAAANRVRPGDHGARAVTEMIGLVAGAFRGSPEVPVAIRLAATDTGRSCQTGADSADGVAISGTEADLLAWLVGRSGGAHLAWLLGRSGGAHLARDGAAELPRLPSSWAT